MRVGLQPDVPLSSHTHNRPSRSCLQATLFSCFHVLHDMLTLHIQRLIKMENRKRHYSKKSGYVMVTGQYSVSSSK